MQDDVFDWLAGTQMGKHSTYLTESRVVYY